CGLRPEMLSPSKTIEPRLGRRKPLSRLKQVVLPAPLGPISPTISPLSTVKSTSRTAASPPKSRVSPRVSRRATGSGRRTRCRRRRGWPRPELGQLPGKRDETAREEQDRQQHGDREKDGLVGAPPERLGEEREEGRAHDGADEVAAPADEVVDQDVGRHQEP